VDVFDLAVLCKRFVHVVLLRLLVHAARNHDPPLHSCGATRRRSDLSAAGAAGVCVCTRACERVRRGHTASGAGCARRFQRLEGAAEVVVNVHALREAAPLLAWKAGTGRVQRTARRNAACAPTLNCPRAREVCVSPAGGRGRAPAASCPLRPRTSASRRRPPSPPRGPPRQPVRLRLCCMPRPVSCVPSKRAARQRATRRMAARSAARRAGHTRLIVRHGAGSGATGICNAHAIGTSPEASAHAKSAAAAVAPAPMAAMLPAR
jgi:hypothetical protein